MIDFLDFFFVVSGCEVALVCDIVGVSILGLSS